jgi:chromosome partitioning protein
MALIIACANQKGGVGKTTTTANLGATLSRMGKHILAIDMDPQANLTAHFGMERELESSVAGALSDRKAELPIYRIEDDSGTMIDVVPASLELASVEFQLAAVIGRELRLREHLERVREGYDFVFIDTPPSLGLLTVNALVAADCVIIPTEARFFSLQGLYMLQETISEAAALNPKIEILGVLLSKYDRRLREEKAVWQYLHERWGDRVFTTEIGTNSKILEAASAGVPVNAYTGARKAVNAYQLLAREVLDRVEAARL